MRFLEAFNEVLELAISFRKEPRHKVYPARGIGSARWRIFDFLPDFEFMKHVQLALPDGRLGSPRAAISQLDWPRLSRARAYPNLHLFCGAAVVQTVRQRYYLNRVFVVSVAYAYPSKCSRPAPRDQKPAAEKASSAQREDPAALTVHVAVVSHGAAGRGPVGLIVGTGRP